MSLFQRIKSVLIGLLVLAAGILMQVANGEKTIYLVALFLCLTMMAAGIGYIIFYFRMSRHMIGGLNQLVTGIVLVDAGLVFLSLSGRPNIFIALYLVVINVFSGCLTAYRALMQKKLGAQHWRLMFYRGAISAVLGIGCLFYMNSANYLMSIYGLSLIASGILRIIEGFRQTDVVYIQ